MIQWQAVYGLSPHTNGQMRGRDGNSLVCAGTTLRPHCQPLPEINLMMNDTEIKVKNFNGKICDKS